MDFLYKICKKCEIEKELDQFHKDTRTKDGREGSCKDCKKKYQQENKERIKINKKIYSEKNRERLLLYKKEYKNSNPEKVIESNKKWYRSLNIEQKENLKIRKNNYHKSKMMNDEIYKIRNITSKILSRIFRQKGYSKKSRTQEILGCSFDEFKVYLESKFEEWMNWKNRGLYNGELKYGWDIDHIIPISTAKTEEDVIELSHYTNLQPLCSKINRDIKRDK